jgi:hypothetical protein
MNVEMTEQVHITVTDRTQLDKLLSAAEAAVLPAALARGTAGILILRLDPQTYTVALNSRVPFGQTLEWSL